MRIISAFVIARIALILVIPQIALASGFEKSNETKTNLNIETVGVAKNDSSLDTNHEALLPYDPNDFTRVVSLEKTIDPERAKVLEKYQTKIAITKFPEGKFTINASAYTAAADECGKSDGITASGLMVKENETIACPPQFPLGTKIKIEGMGTYVCQDRGGAIKGNHIDIYMETKAEAFAFGRQNLLAEVVK